MKASDILSYCNQFKTGNEYNDSIYLNDSVLHATIITNEIFEKALSETGKTVNMYCGRFSLFRDENRAEIDNLKLQCDISDLSDEKKKEWAEFNPFSDLQHKLGVFLDDENKGHLNLIMEQDIESLKKCEVWKVLKRGMENNRVSLFALKESMGLGHFCVTEEAYRLEKSDNNKTASGCFKDKVNADILNDNFEFLKKASEHIRA